MLASQIEREMIYEVLRLGGGPVRERLTTARTYYVRTDGSNGNNGLVDSATGAFLTGQKAVDNLVGVDLGGQDVTIQFGPGTYTSNVVIEKPIVGGGLLTLRGDPTTPANVLFDTASYSVFTRNPGVRVALSGLKLKGTSGGVLAQKQAIVELTGLNELDVTPGSHLEAQFDGQIWVQANYTIVGNAANHWNAFGRGIIRAPSRTITISGSLAFSNAYAVIADGALIYAPTCTFVGSATGVRFKAGSNGTVSSGGANKATYFPGDQAGTELTEGIWT